MAWGVYRARETPRLRVPIDAMGLALLVLVVGSLQLVLDMGKQLDWFDAPVIVALALVALVGGAVFLVWELTDRHPIVDLRLFALRNFGFGALTNSVSYGLFFGNVVLLPLWLQQTMGWSALHAGMALAPVGIFAIVLTPLAGRKVGVWDPRWMVSVAFVGFAIVMWMRSGFTPQTDLWQIMLPTVVQGAAMSMMFIPLATLTLAGLPPERMAAAAGLSNFARMTAGAMGASIATTLWERRAALHHAHLSETLAQGHGALASALQALHGAGLGDAQTLAQINRLIDQQAYTRAVDDVFLASSWLFMGLIALVWFTRRPAALRPTSPAAAPPAPAAATVEAH
jgi:DHA2 family multidrug resistance protein